LDDHAEQLALLLLAVGARDASAAEADQAMIDTGWKHFKDLKKNPCPIFVTKDGKAGTLTLTTKDGKILVDAKGITARIAIGWCEDCRWNAREGDVLYNVADTPIKVGDFELKKGECAEFKGSAFEKTNEKVKSKK